MKMLEFPSLRQTFEYDCGAKALQTVLAYYGLDVREDAILETARTDDKHGTLVGGIVKAVRKYGLECRAKSMTVSEVMEHIDRDVPVILVLQAWTRHADVEWESHFSDGHYAVAIGYDEDNIYFEDPYTLARTYLRYDELERRWHDVDREGREHFRRGIAVYGRPPRFSSEFIIHMD